MQLVISEPSKTRPGSTPTPDQVAALERLLSADTLRRAPRVHDVLRYMIESVIAGHPETVNEQHIGEEVFRRPRGYSPAEDNIVRVTVSNLRTRLEDYYREQGKDERWLLDVPKGKYVPHLRLREAPLPRPVPVLEIVPAPPPSIPTAPAESRWPWLVFAIVAVGCAALYFGLVRPAPPSAETGFIQQFLGDRNIPTSIVLADANLQAYRVIFQKNVTLQDYINRSYLESAGPATRESRLWTYISSHNDTTITSAVLIGRLQGALRTLPVTVRHPQELNLRDFQEGTCLLLGGPWINPWGQLFEPNLTFQLIPQDQNPAASEIRNLAPQPGEPARYVPHSANGFSVSYARIAVVPNLSGKGHIILLGSNTSDSMEAAGDFLVKPYGVTDLLRNFHCSRVADLPAFEVMLEVRGLSRTPDSVRVIAHRVVPPKP